jgi:hypothetical protein
VWNELLLYNEQLRQVCKPSTMLFFGMFSLVLLDCMNATALCQVYILAPFPNLLTSEILEFGPKVHEETGYYPIAWAFLKLMSSKGGPNLGPARLQLYHYAGSKRPSVGQVPRVPLVWYEWIYHRNLGAEPYPGSLYIEVTGMMPPHDRVVRGVRPLLPTDHEQSDAAEKEQVAQILSLTNYSSNAQLLSTQFLSYSLSAPLMEPPQAFPETKPLTAPVQLTSNKRSALEKCQIPDKLLHVLEAGPKGCSALALDPSGRLLAAACLERLVFAIKVFDLETGNLVFTFKGHPIPSGISTLIYELSWNSLGTGLGTECVS